MSRNKKIALIAIIVLLLALLLWAWIALAPKAPGENANIPPDLTNTTGGLNTSGNLNTAPQERPPVSEQIGPPEATEPQEAGDERNNVRRLAASFAERFGSFSNEGNYQNMLDLRVFMSASMRAWADRYVADAVADPSAEYYGITTRAVSTTLDAFDEGAGTAAVTVFTQRTERRGLAQTQEVRYQSVRIGFITQDGAWKVDSAYWQEDSAGAP